MTESNERTEALAVEECVPAPGNGVCEHCYGDNEHRPWCETLA